eukprot:GDKJ01043228.1.p1 GENE.GDKJ01043228.1~~GDKJ01043228.1.p1  ORF type:complete len:600 (+),score=77.19 GDKJ01043228.1:655-2454(+)
MISQFISYSRIRRVHGDCGACMKIEVFVFVSGLILLIGAFWMSFNISTSISAALQRQEDKRNFLANPRILPCNSEDLSRHIREGHEGDYVYITGCRLQTKRENVVVGDMLLQYRTRSIGCIRNSTIADTGEKSTNYHLFAGEFSSLGGFEFKNNPVLTISLLRLIGIQRSHLDMVVHPSYTCRRGGLFGFNGNFCWTKKNPITNARTVVSLDVMSLTSAQTDFYEQADFSLAGVVTKVKDQEQFVFIPCDLAECYATANDIESLSSYAFHQKLRSSFLPSQGYLSLQNPSEWKHRADRIQTSVGFSIRNSTYFDHVVLPKTIIEVSGSTWFAFQTLCLSLLIITAFFFLSASTTVYQYSKGLYLVMRTVRESKRLIAKIVSFGGSVAWLMVVIGLKLLIRSVAALRVNSQTHTAVHRSINSKKQEQDISNQNFFEVTRNNTLSNVVSPSSKQNDFFDSRATSPSFEWVSVSPQNSLVFDNITSGDSFYPNPINLVTEDVISLHTPKTPQLLPSTAYTGNQMPQLISGVLLTVLIPLVIIWKVCYLIASTCSDEDCSSAAPFWAKKRRTWLGRKLQKFGFVRKLKKLKIARRRRRAMSDT